MQTDTSSPRRAPVDAARAPLVVIESANPAAEAHLARVLDAARAAGWHPLGTWIAARGRVVCHGRIASAEEAVLALRAAVAGAGVVIVAATSREVTDRLVDDLRRLGPVEHVTADVGPRAAVDETQRRLLQLLAQGWTLGQAATHLGLPRRTADRRLGAARRALGAERTADALARARELGWLDVIGAAE